MTHDLLFYSCIGCLLVGSGLGFILFANWQADRTWQRILREISDDAERAARLAEHHQVNR